MVDRRWTHDEKVELGIAEEASEVDVDMLRDLIGDARTALDRLFDTLK
jgi:hypothetical protein